MKQRLILGCLLGAVGWLALWTLRSRFDEPVAVFEPPVRQIESAPLCPWRAPETDLPAFFPAATAHTAETRILSGQRVELAKRLGRPPQPEENALSRHRIFAGTNTIGFVLTRRAKGENGAIEVAVAVNSGGEIERVSLQRLREPEPVAKILRDQAWLSLFRGRTDSRGWESDDLCQLPEEARASARAVREAVRSVLVLEALAGASHH
jgi:hypothetical protein